MSCHVYSYMVASATALSLKQHVSSMCVYYCWLRKLIASSRVSLHPTTYVTHHLSIIAISTNYGTLVFLKKIHKFFRSPALYRTSAVTGFPLISALSKRAGRPFLPVVRYLAYLVGLLRPRTSVPHRWSGEILACLYKAEDAC